MAFYKYLGQKEHVESFIKGNMLFSNIKKFRELEDTNDGRADEHDGMYSVNGCREEIDTIRINFLSNNSDGQIMCVSKDLPENDLWANKKLGEWIIKIEDEAEFIKRMKDAAKKEELEIMHKPVEYRSKWDGIDDSQDIFEKMSIYGPDYLFFMKRDEPKYTTQKEYRFLLKNAPKGKEFHWLRLGDINNLCEVISKPNLNTRG